MEKWILVDENCGIAEGGWWQGFFLSLSTLTCITKKTKKITINNTNAQHALKVNAAQQTYIAKNVGNHGPNIRN